MAGVYTELKERGFIKQETAPIEVFDPVTHVLKKTLSVNKLLANEKATFYVGFDATADSLHIGSLMPIMAMSHLQRAGHLPICIIGGGTTMIGDPSGKTQMRQMLTAADIESNGKSILAQLQRYLTFGEGQGLFVNNADWLMPLNYIEFLRDIGKHFRVNEMIRMEAYRMRLERDEGLSFIEFNYQLLQAYDFLVLFEKYGCTLQMGGDDQWGNILAGIDLIHKVKRGRSHGLTFPLLTTASGGKMGKTENGAVWLDPNKTSPFEYYQFWINTDDRDVERFLKFFTFLSLDEITSMCSDSGKDLRVAKEALAFEATKITHGEEEAQKSRSSSRILFSGDMTDESQIPNVLVIEKSEVEGLKLRDVLVRTELASSKGAAAMLVKGGGVYINGKQVFEPGATLTELLQGKTSLVIRKGKKTYHRITIE